MLLITQPRVGTSHNEILSLQIAAEGLGWDVVPAPYGWRLDDDLIQSGAEGVPYGSQAFCEVIAQQMGWELLQQPFDWLAKLPRQYTDRQVDFMTLADAKKITERKFIKPADDKCFDAKIYEPGEFQPPECIQDDYPVLVSDIVEWDMEYRVFVSKNDFRPLTWSNYLFHGQINDPKLHRTIPGDLPHIENYMYGLLENCYLNRMNASCVIDIGVIHNKGWAVIETNPAWASGLYGCDPGLALVAMKESCRKV